MMISALAISLALAQIFIFNQMSFFGGVLLLIIPLIYLLKSEVRAIELVYALVLCAFVQSLFLPPGQGLVQIIATLFAGGMGVAYLYFSQTSQFKRLLKPIELIVVTVLMSISFWAVILLQAPTAIAQRGSLLFILSSALIAYITTLVARGVIRKLV